MARYRMRVRTDRSPAEAFAYLSDLRNFAEWDPGVSSSTQVEGDGPRLGATYDVEASGSTLRYEIDRYEPPSQVRVTGENRWLTSVDAIGVLPDGDGSIVTYEADLTLKGPLRLGDPLLSLAFRRIGDRAASGLVDQLDGIRVE